MSNTKIEWAEKVWNPTTGCTKISPGCLNCYAETITKRFPDVFPNEFEFTHHPSRLDLPRKWKKGKRIFVNSMSDLFHGSMEPDFLREIFDTMNECLQHTFMILTKRSGYALALSRDLKLNWTPNIWMGVSIESPEYKYRIKDLLKIPAKVRFLSCEPLLEDLQLTPENLEQIDWVIAGGESGRGHRPVEAEWVRKIRDICTETDTRFFFKQWGGMTPKAGGRILDGQEWNEFPR